MDLEVFVNDIPVGILTRDEEGFFDFRYHASARPDQAVSLLMPVTDDPEMYAEFGLLPSAFQVSLPEGAVLEKLRSLYRKDVNFDEPFELLRLVGRNGIGRLTFGGKRSQASVQIRDALLRDARSPSAARRLWENLDRIGADALCVSGAMPKVLIDRESSGCQGDRPGTLILDDCIVKFDSPGHYGAVLLEYACMTVCRNLGFDVPRLEISPSGDALIVQRFDRDENGNYLGFEDICALAGYQRSKKYLGSVEELFEIGRSFIAEERRDADLETLIRMVLVNDLLRNGDAHLKNFALLYDNPKNARLSPIYDVLNTTMFYPDDRPALAWDIDRTVDQVWLEDSRAMDEFSRISGKESESLLRESREISDVIRASMADVSTEIANLPLNPDRRIFAANLPRYFDQILRENGLLQQKTAPGEVESMPFSGGVPGADDLRGGLREDFPEA